VSERLPAVKPAELIRVLEGRGWQLARTRGSHHVFKHPGFPNRIVVPVHGRELKRGILVAILKDAGISRDELRRSI
jgi:predicted RNA binding protein YcfA (HicA-like mRNA interferase family)